MSKAPAQETQKIENEHADEELEVSGSEVDSASDSQNSGAAPAAREPQQKQAPNRANMRNETLESNKPADIQGAYKASDYSNLAVSNEVKELFKYISRYTPVSIEIDTKLKAFVPDYIPTVGEVDAFIKMPRPDGQPETLGLNILVPFIADAGRTRTEPVRSGSHRHPPRQQHEAVPRGQVQQDPRNRKRRQEPKADSDVDQLGRGDPQEQAAAERELREADAGHRLADAGVAGGGGRCAERNKAAERGSGREPGGILQDGLQHYRYSGARQQR